MVIIMFIYYPFIYILMSMLTEFKTTVKKPHFTILFVGLVLCHIIVGGSFILIDNNGLMTTMDKLLGMAIMTTLAIGSAIMYISSESINPLGRTDNILMFFLIGFVSLLLPIISLLA